MANEKGISTFNFACDLWGRNGLGSSPSLRQIIPVAEAHLITNEPSWRTVGAEMVLGRPLVPGEIDLTGDTKELLARLIKLRQRQWERKPFAELPELCVFRLLKNHPIRIVESSDYECIMGFPGDLKPQSIGNQAIMATPDYLFSKSSGRRDGNVTIIMGLGSHIKAELTQTNVECEVDHIHLTASSETTDAEY